MIVVKKYGNRRLYDTSESRYVTLEELAEKIRAGADVQVHDAKTNEDLTQATLTQIIIEGRRAARLLPVPLLVQMIRMQDEALAEFLGTTMTWAMRMYLQAKRGAQAVSPFNPFAMAPFAATNAFARMLGAGSGWESPQEPMPMPMPAPAPEPPSAVAADGDVAALRREIEELKTMLRPRAKKRAKRG